ncbi:MAG TPA: FliM/FliN family flagellar motor switch protein [Vicinamibacterales bacterium]|nr:FliM/FliN family flagellar motor switch protein [Vicinamibacterales bacterium]
MADTVTLDAVIKAVAEELMAVCGIRLGGDATSAPTDAPRTDGWSVSLAVSGAVVGRIAVWTDRASAAACARIALKTDAMPGDVEVSEWLASLAQDAATAAAARPELAGVQFGAAKTSVGQPPADAHTFYLAVPNVASCVLSVGIERPAVSQRASDERLGAVLGVELPLVVRFGRTVMPLRAIAELGPGAVIDMGRSPDEPVEVLVGDRLIARGEVVVVGGNYGVRITALATSAETVN